MESTDSVLESFLRIGIFLKFGLRSTDLPLYVDLVRTFFLPYFTEAVSDMKPEKTGEIDLLC